MRYSKSIIVFFVFMLFPFHRETLQAQQYLPVDGIVNARDLGGYQAADGKTVRHGLLLRSASLAEAKEKDLSYLSGIPVGTVVDFRMDFELRGKEDKVIPGARYVRLPVNSSGIDVTDDDAKELSRHKSFDIRKFIMIAAFLQMAVHADSAILFHCTQGKDRAGLASAYILSALGVDRETIIKDFDATNAIYAKDVKRLSRRVRFFGGKDKEVETVKAFIGANTNNFIKVLDLIDSEYGSMLNYIQGPLGLSDDDILCLKERYLQ